ncbi:MAG TPA: hypothetical protein VGE57_07150 [Solimonas sp.]
MFDRSYWFWMGGWSLVFLGLVLSLDLLAGQLGAHDPRRWLLMVPVLAVTAIGLRLELRQLRRLDELQRQMYLEAALTALIVTLGYSSAVLVLERFAAMAAPSQAWTMLVIGAAFVVGLLLARRRYR